MIEELFKGNYNFRYTDAELDLLKSTFADNEPLLKLLRKVFLPIVTDTAANVGGITEDIGLHPDFDIKTYKSMEEAVIAINARLLALKHIGDTLVKIKILAGMKTETVEETKKRLEKNSAK